MKTFLKINLPIFDPKRDLSITRFRLVLATLLVLILTSVVIARLINLQVLNYDRYKTLSVENRVGLVPVPPVRGQIIDRNGQILADNHPAYELEILPDKVENIEHTIKEIRKLIALNERELEAFVRVLKLRPSFEPQILKHNLSSEEASIIAVNQHRFPGISLRANLRRTYPFSELVAHVVGYVSRISDEDLKNIDLTAYRGTRYIGKVGVEANYEEELLGVAGYETVEFNAHGRIIRSLDYQSPTAGWNVNLTLDIELQRVAHDALGNRKGSVVVLQPNSGDVLALVSSPDYDPNLFSKGLSVKSYDILRNSPGKPLMNRAIYGRYAPGSTIKPILGVSALEDGFDFERKIFCEGEFHLPGRDRPYRCWKRDGHGEVNLVEAIAQSCDVFFYELSLTLGIEQMARWFRHFGLGKETKVDLNGESIGLVPDSAWKKSAYDESWFPGETVITGIGQGYLLATPLQLAVATAAIANNGKIIKPRLLSHLENTETGDILMGPDVEVMSRIPTSSSMLSIISKGMIDVVHGSKGTARAIGIGLPYIIAGKTGTSQLISITDHDEKDRINTPDNLVDHALFVAFAPADNPRIVIAIVVENGGSGSKAAAPIAKKIFDYYFIDRLLRASATWKEFGFG
tara:strand:- start:525 stop:2420 length:1896 start_codon:yes stop_codon:yes gene_type:complete